MSTKKLQILASLGNKVYTQNDEPTDAVDGDLWVDMEMPVLKVKKNGSWEEIASNSVGSLTDLGITATAAELNYMSDVTSNVQEQLDDVTYSISTKADIGHTHEVTDVNGAFANTGGEISGNTKIRGRLTVGPEDTYHFVMGGGNTYCWLDLRDADNAVLNNFVFYPNGLTTIKGIKLTSNSYGTTLPDAGNPGRIFFKKV